MGKIKQVPITSDSMRYPAAVVYAAAADQDNDFMTGVGSVILNRYNSGRPEFGADTGNIMDVINKENAFYETGTDRYKDALAGKFPNKQEEAAYKRALAVTSGLIKGSIDVKPGHFWFNDSEEASQRKKFIKSNGKKGINYDLLEVTGSYGIDRKSEKPFKFWKYKEPVTKNKILSAQQQLKDEGLDPGPIDGIMGKRTKAAMKAYKEKTGKSIL
jgi:hypothetical protein